MNPFKIIRKIGKMLRGGAGRREILLGAMLGVLLGFCPTASLTVAFLVLVTLLLNANIGFTLLGAAAGKALAMLVAPLSFHTGYFLIHGTGLEGLFADLASAPVTALMGLQVYALIGGLPYAIVLGIVFGKLMSLIVTKIREQMAKAVQHGKVSKAVGNPISRFFLWLAFGKHKISTADVLAKQSPLFRKSGIILVAFVVVIGLLLEFLLLDAVVAKGLKAALQARTGAQVDIGEVRVSPATGKVAIENLRVADPDKLTHDLVQLDRLVADVSTSALLRNAVVIDLLAGSKLERDVRRETPAKPIEKEKAVEDKEREDEPEQEDKPGTSLDEYLAEYEKWKERASEAHEVIEKVREKAEAAREKRQRKRRDKDQDQAAKKRAVAKAERLGYLKAAADLVRERPAWVVREAVIEKVHVASGFPLHVLQARSLSSHPELLGAPTVLTLTPVGARAATVQAELRLHEREAPHSLAVRLEDLPVEGVTEPSEDFPVRVSGGRADLDARGDFSLDTLDIPFSLIIRDLRATVEEGETLAGLDGEIADKVLKSLRTIDIEGKLVGSLRSPRVQIDTDRLMERFKKEALDRGRQEVEERVEQAKEELEQRAEEAKDKLQTRAEEELKKKAEEVREDLEKTAEETLGKNVEEAQEEVKKKLEKELKKALKDEDADELREKAEDALKNLFK